MRMLAFVLAILLTGSAFAQGTFPSGPKQPPGVYVPCTPTGTPAYCTGGTGSSGSSAMQTIVNANPAGTTYYLGPGIWSAQTWVPQLGDRYIGDSGGGTIFDGGGASQAALFYQGEGSSGTTNLAVTLKDMTLRNYNTSTSNCNAGAVQGAIGWTFINVNFIDNACSGVNLGNYSTMIGGKVSGNLHSGVLGNGSYITVKNVEISGNNPLQRDGVYNEAGATKFVGSNIVLQGNYVHDNSGDGLWVDVISSNVIINGNIVTNNVGEGIRYEVSTTGTINYNYVANNAFGQAVGQIGLWNSDHTNVYSNVIVVYGNQMGLVFDQEQRTDYPHSYTGSNSAYYNNIIWASSASTNGMYGYRGISQNSYLTTGTSGTGTTATVTFAGSALYTVGDSITIANLGAYNGAHTVTVASAGSVSFASSATGSVTGGTIIYTSIPAIGPSASNVMDYNYFCGPNSTDTHYAAYPTYTGSGTTFAGLQAASSTDGNLDVHSTFSVCGNPVPTAPYFIAPGN